MWLVVRYVAVVFSTLDVLLYKRVSGWSADYSGSRERTLFNRWRV